MDLQTKHLHLCAKIIELVGMAKGKKAHELAYQQLKSWAAWKKMQSIIKAQRGKNPNIKSEEIQLAKFKKEVKAEKDGTVKTIDMKLINLTTRTFELQLMIKEVFIFTKKLWDKVKKNDIIYVMYANQQNKIDMALENLKGKKMYEIK
jgi:thymidine phosphorylase